MSAQGPKTIPQGENFPLRFWCESKFKCWAGIMLLVSAFVPLNASAHPLKLSASMITYDEVQNTVRMECKVFIDDFQLGLVNSVLKGTDPNTVKREDRRGLVEQYFQKFYQVKHNGRSLVWKVESLVPLYRQNVLLIKFQGGSVKLSRGDKLEIESTVFFQEFGKEQTNRIAVVLPAFDIDEGHATHIGNSAFSYVLGRPKP